MFRTLVREWGVRYIKMDFMDNSAIEGYYYRPNTTALEAQRIGLELIRKAVGEPGRAARNLRDPRSPLSFRDS